MAKQYKTYTKEKWLYFALSIAAYFLPFVITAACLLPFVEAATGFKIAIGLGIVIINGAVFVAGIFISFFAHFPMFNLPAVIYLSLSAFFKLDIFKTYSDIFNWIELAAAIGSIASCILWGLHLKYAGYQKSIKAAVKSGAFVMKEENSD